MYISANTKLYKVINKILECIDNLIEYTGIRQSSHNTR